MRGFKSKRDAVRTMRSSNVSPCCGKREVTVRLSPFDERLEIDLVELRERLPRRRVALREVVRDFHDVFAELRAEPGEELGEVRARIEVVDDAQKIIGDEG